MADEPQQQPGLDESEKPEATEPKKPRTPTRYVAMIWRPQTATFAPVLEGHVDDDKRPTLKEFQGYRRDDVMQELEREGIIEADEESGWSPFVLLVPASSAAVLRAKIVTERKVEVE